MSSFVSLFFPFVSFILCKFTFFSFYFILFYFYRPLSLILCASPLELMHCYIQWFYIIFVIYFCLLFYINAFWFITYIVSSLHVIVMRLLCYNLGTFELPFSFLMLPHLVILLLSSLAYLLFSCLGLSCCVGGFK